MLNKIISCFSDHRNRNKYKSKRKNCLKNKQRIAHLNWIDPNIDNNSPGFYPATPHHVWLANSRYNIKCKLQLIYSLVCIGSITLGRKKGTYLGNRHPNNVASANYNSSLSFDLNIVSMQQFYSSFRCTGYKERLSISHRKPTDVKRVESIHIFFFCYCI